MNKEFKVAKIGEQPSDNGLFTHVMIAADAECWQVLRNHTESYPPPWDVGHVVEVSLRMRKLPDGDSFMAPDWEEVAAENPIKYDLHNPYGAVAESWGEQFAKKFHLPSPSTKSVKRPTVVFLPTQFATSDKTTSDEKARLANQFVRFCEDNYREDYFTQSLFDSLSQMFNDVPSGGKVKEFYEAWLTDANGRTEFLRRLASQTIAGDPQFSLADVARAIQAYVVQKALPRVTKTVKTTEAMAERGTLRKLLLKYGLPSNLKLPGQK